MSQQGLARTQQLLQVIGQQLPSIAQASETPGIDLLSFVYGTLIRCGLQPANDLIRFVSAVVGVIDPPQNSAPAAAQTVDDDRLVNS